MRQMVGYISEGAGSPPVVVRTYSPLFRHILTPEKLLTGATGTLGSHILHALFQRKVKKIVCLCREKTASEATTRLLEGLKSRRLSIAWPADTIVQACASSLSERQLGLPNEVYSQLANEVTVIIHAAWPVNFLAPFLSFDPALAGTRNLLDLARLGPKKRVVFCSSTASVIRAPSPIREEMSINPEDASPLGYSRSKWVAEGIVRRAGGEVIRLGQLSGNFKTGLWNPGEGWPMILKTVRLVRCLPDLQEKMQWLPLDIAAQAVVRIGLRRGVHEEKKVWHVLNAHSTEWSEVLDAVDSCHGKVPRVPAQEWIKLLEKEEAKGVIIRLMGLWKEAVSLF